MENLTFCAPCLLGMEGLLANELRFMGMENVNAQNGRVLFNGGYDFMARANIRSRYAERIHILLDEFEAYSFEELFTSVKSIPWENFIGRKDAFPVKGRSLSSKLASVPDCQRIIKKAIVERLKGAYSIDWFEENGSLYQVQFLILKNRVSILIDTSGAGLHKRGYRKNANEAPIKETLAAAMVELSHVRSGHTVVDPMCGSGTILIEAALKAMKIAPGIERSFAAENWTQINKKVWQNERESAKAIENRNCGFIAYGYDIDDRALRIAEENAVKAGVADKVVLARRDIRSFTHDTDRASVITNPPYGERILDISAAEELYKIMGEKFTERSGWSYTIISPDDDFEKLFARKADKRRKLYNGMIKCQVYMYYK